VQNRYEEIRTLGGEVLAVSFAGPDRVAAYVARYPLPFPALADPSRDAYHAFELTRTSWLRMLSPRVLLKYLGLVLRGWMPWKPAAKEDLLQLGGDFVLDRQRRIVYAYPSANPTDRPAVEELVQAVRTAVM
jgi:peroxiredoxin